MAALIEAARDPACPFTVALVVSNVPDAPGLVIARDAGIATAARPHQGLKRADFDDWIEEQLVDADIEWVALAGYMRLLSPGFIAGRAGHILNIHPSLLPAHKGLDTHQRAIDAGDAKAGCSVHIVTAALDDGPVIAQAEVLIRPGDTADSLAARVLVEEHKLYPRALAAHIVAARSE